MSEATETRTELPRTQPEIMARTQAAQERDSFGFEWHEYLSAMTLDTARPLLKPDYDGADWDEPNTVERVSARAKDYLSFWLEKIEGERGISVCRATAHYTAWKWLLGHPDADTFPGSVDGGDGGWYQRDAYEYIRAQIESGEWDALTAASVHRETE